MDYTSMSSYYDLIMTSGYYDYPGIVDSLTSHLPRTNEAGSVAIVELGCGTGLILEELARRDIRTGLVGVDLTESMLGIARDRLRPFPNISLQLQNVTRLSLRRKFDVAFSYGGVWYFVIDSENEPFLVSHIPGDAENRKGLAEVANHITQGGSLLLGIQGPHHDYQKAIANGLTYSQKVTPCDRGFIKDYYLTNDTRTLMHQTTQYRTYPFNEVRGILAGFGLHCQDDAGSDKHFLEFKKS